MSRPSRTSAVREELYIVYKMERFIKNNKIQIKIKYIFFLITYEYERCVAFWDCASL
jgi:hypothetical protein